MTNILVVEDRADIRLSLRILLEDNGFEVCEAENPQVAQVIIKQKNIALIMLDMNYTLDIASGDEGIAFLQWLKDSHISIPKIAMTAWSNTDLVVKAMRLGAADFIEKPWRNKQVLHCVKQQLTLSHLESQNTSLKQELASSINGEYQWRSDCMKQLIKKIKAVANTDVSVLFTGENGTGKSELAKLVHQLSARGHEAFISVNMGAIAENLFESEMFGHKKGAFTDAKSTRIGRVELADNGSLFLDEIANIPLSQQAKLLRVLESGEYEILGSSQTLTMNCRVISATNAKFQALFNKEQFREDLYFRLNTIEFHVPALKERVEDILPLAEHFIALFAQKYNKPIKPLSEQAVSSLKGYDWPGNIREMSHLIERAVLLSESDVIRGDDLPINAVTVAVVSEIKTLEQSEIDLIKRALKQTNNHIPKAAVLLGLTKSSMYRRVEKYGLA